MGQGPPGGGDPRFEAARLAPEQVPFLRLAGAAAAERRPDAAAVGIEHL
jgi:hypothetical protein